MTLTKEQQNIKGIIIIYGKANGFTDDDIQTAVNVAYIESSFNLKTSNPDSTATGLYQYLQTPGGNRWSERHADKNFLGAPLDINNPIHQIKAFYDDIEDYTDRYDNKVSDKDKGSVTKEEYIYIKHHDGANAKPLETAEGRGIYNNAVEKANNEDKKH